VLNQMGYSSIKITVDVYGHMVPGADVQYIDRLEAPRKGTQPRRNQRVIGLLTKAVKLVKEMG
jgi:hypothetical protein